MLKRAKKLISESGVKNSSTKLAKRRSSVIASAGQGHTRGQVSYLMIDTYINQSVIALFPDETILDSLFLFYSLNLKYEHFRQMSNDHSVRGSLTTKMLGDEEILLPPLADQKVIAKILSDLDEKIELNNEMNKTLEEIAQAIFKRWFIDFEFPNENGDPYKSSGGEMVKSELGMIPKGCSVGKLRDICKSITVLEQAKLLGYEWVKV
jgi:type I restriction enzyme S subunit